MGQRCTKRTQADAPQEQIFAAVSSLTLSPRASSQGGDFGGTSFFKSASAAVTAAVRFSRLHKSYLQEEWLSEQLRGSLSQPEESERSSSGSTAPKLSAERQRLQDAAIGLSASLVDSAATLAALTRELEDCPASPASSAGAAPTVQEEREAPEALPVLLGQAFRAQLAVQRRFLTSLICCSAAARTRSFGEASPTGSDCIQVRSSPSAGQEPRLPALHSAPAIQHRSLDRSRSWLKAGPTVLQTGVRPSRLIEMLYVVGHRAQASGAGGQALKPGAPVKQEPCVLARFRGVNGSCGEVGPVPLLDERVASFSLPVVAEVEHDDAKDLSLVATPLSGSRPRSAASSRKRTRKSTKSTVGTGHVPGMPFAFTVLAAVLPEDDEAPSAPDPTDVLYCIAVTFDDVLCVAGECPGTAAGVSPYAFCVVTRHPFVSAFGELLLRLHAGEDGHPGSWAAIHRRLGQAAAQLYATRPVVLEGKHLRRGRTDPLHLALSGGGQQEDQRALTDMWPGRHARTTRGDPQCGQDCHGSIVSFPSMRSSSVGRSMEQWEDSTSSLPTLDRFVYHVPSPGACPPWASAWARQRCDALAMWATLPVFQKLGVDALLRVLTALLLELRVLVVARSVAAGSEVVLGLSSLLWPFGWQHLMLPICPPALQDAIIDAPVPFLCALREVTPALDRHARGEAATGPSRQTVTESCSKSRSSMGTASASSTCSTFVLSEAARHHGVVICNADRGTVCAPADLVHVIGASCPAPAELEERRPALESLRERLRLQPGKANDQQAVAAAARAEIVCAMTALARGVLEASRLAAEGAEEQGSGGWLRATQDHMCSQLAGPSDLDDCAFRREFVNTEACLMLLAAASAAEAAC